jgi:phage-related tail protein
MKALEPMYAARTQARARLDYTAEAVERAKRLAATAADHLKSLELRADEAEANQATELAVQIARGGPSADLPAAVDEDLALTAARRDHAVKAKALAKLEGIRVEAQTDLAAAERAVMQAVDQVLGDEIAERAGKVEHHLNEAHRLGTSLKYFAAAAGIHATLIVPDSTLRVLDRLSTPLIDSLEIPINMEKLGDVAAFRDWTARREKMITGDAATEATAA